MKWEKVEIGKVSKVISGFAFKSKDFQPFGTPVIKIKNIKDENIVIDESDCVDLAIEVPLRFRLCKGDILISLTGSHITLPSSVVGRVAKYRHDTTSYLNQRAGKFINIDNGKCYNDYLFYFLLKRETLTKIANKAQGAANQANISPGDVESVEISLPPLPTQRRIASILSAYDDLIENNLKRIRLLEKKAFLRYKFIVKSEKLQKISVFDYAEIMSGGTPSTTNPNFWDGEIPFFTPKDLASHSGYYLTDTERKLTELGLEKCNSKLFPRDTIFITARGTVGKLILAKIPSAISQSNYAVTTRNGSLNYFLFLALIDKIEHFKQLAVGGVFDTIIVDTFKMIFIELPDESAISQFNTEITPVFQLIDVLQKQNTKLREVRDIFLPRLMSGEIEV